MFGRLRRAVPAALLEGTAGKALATIADQGVVSAGNFATTIIIGRACVKEEMGLYLLGFSIVLFVTNLQTALVSSAYIVYSPRLKGRAHARYTGSTLIHQLIYNAAVILGLVAGWAASTLWGGIEGLAPLLKVLAFLMVFISLKEYARQACFAGMRPISAFALDAAVATIQVGGLVGLAYYGLLSARSAYLVIGVGCAVAVTVWLLSWRNGFALGLPEAVADFRKNWSYCRWLVACNFVYLGSNHMYPWLLAWFHGTEDTGVLGACNGVLFLANPFLLGIGNFLGPKAAHALAEGGIEQMRRMVTKANILCALSLGSFCVLMVVFGGWLVVLLYGQKYAGNGLLVAILALAQLCLGLTVPTNYALNALERADVQFKSLLVSLAVTATLGLWLVMTLGTLGVASGMFACTSAGCLYKWIVFRRWTAYRRHDPRFSEEGTKSGSY